MEEAKQPCFSAVWRFASVHLIISGELVVDRDHFPLDGLRGKFPYHVCSSKIASTGLPYSSPAPTYNFALEISEIQAAGEVQLSKMVQ